MKKLSLIALKTFSMAVSAATLLGIFTSCGNSITETTPKPVEEGTAFIRVGKISASYRTVKPVVNEDNLKNLILSGKRTGEDSYNELLKSNSLSALGDEEIEIQTGAWSFKLDGTLNDIAFSATKDITIAKDTTNTISFVLRAVEQFGGMSVKLNFTDQNVNKVTATFKQSSKAAENLESIDYEGTAIAQTADADGNTVKSVTYARSISDTEKRLAPGSYYLCFDFYADGTTVPLNSAEYIVRIAGGFNSTHEETISINETYTIAYKEITEDETTIDVDEDEFAGAGVFTKKYSRKTDTFTLPQLERAHWVFGGWFEDASFEGNPVTQITKGTTENITLYAKWNVELAEPLINVSFESTSGEDIGLIDAPSTDDENNITFPATTGFTTYTWYVDGVIQEDYQDESTLIVNASDWKTGIYDISLTATKVTENADGSSNTEYFTWYGQLPWTRHFTATFVTDDDSLEIPTQTVYDGEYFHKPNIETQPACGWYICDSNDIPRSYTPFNFEEEPTKNVRLVAINKIEIKKGITFKEIMQTFGANNEDASIKFLPSEVPPAAETTNKYYLDAVTAKGAIEPEPAAGNETAEYNYKANIGSIIPVWYDEENETIWYYNGTGCPLYLHEYSNQMFYECKGLTEIDLSCFDGTYTYTMYQMFASCSNLTKVTFNDNFVTSATGNIARMFESCSSLTAVDVSKFNTTNVTDMSYMFRSTKIENLDLSNFQTSNVTNMSYMFSMCTATKTIDLSSFDTSKVTDFTYMFDRCRALTTIYASDAFVTTAATSAKCGNMFDECSKLKGGNNTSFSASNDYQTYARIDTAADETTGTEAIPGYFTAKN